MFFDQYSGVKCVWIKQDESTALKGSYNGILHSREKEGAPTLSDNMDGTGEHYAK